ncbi:MAG TPA: restriction endonuclease subunit S [Alphaproteobacteria bacterium]|nr:restriction endonuclease subunit S [Alphaproteobacteria bacterium]
MKYPVAEIGRLCLQTERRDPRNLPDLPFEYIDISSVDKDLKTIIRSQEIIGRDAPSRARKVIHTGDVLVSTVRPNLNAVAIVPPELDGQIASTGFCVLRPDPVLIHSRYLFYWTLTQDFISYLTARMHGANYPAVTDEVVRRHTIPLPPLCEQRRIVEIVDQANALRRKRAEADAKVLRIMRASFIRIFGHPDEWTSNGSTKPLASLVEVYGGGTPSKQNRNFWEGEIPWVSPKDMKQDIVYDSADHISRSAAEQTNLKYINPGTIMIVVRGMILAHTVPIALAGSRLTINQDMKALELKSTDINPIYLYAALRVSDRKILSKVRTAAHGTRKIETEELLQLPIFIPSSEDLDRFHRMMTEYNGVVFRIMKSRGIIEQLFESLLHRAFSGNLTASWREAHMQELLAEMEQQTKWLAGENTHGSRETSRLQQSLFRDEVPE